MTRLLLLLTLLPFPALALWGGDTITVIATVQHTDSTSLTTRGEALSPVTYTPPSPPPPASVAPVAQVAPPAPDVPPSPHPPELTIMSFRQMPLIGTDFQLIAERQRTDTHVEYDITYRSNGLLITGVYAHPTVGEGPWPVVILNHGWYPLDKYTSGHGMARERAFFADHGYAVLHSDYREHAGSDTGHDPRNLYDGTLGYSVDSFNAIQALCTARPAQADCDRLALFGHSMGGDIGLNLLTAHPTTFDAATLYAPAHTDAWHNFNRWKHDYPYGPNTLEHWGEAPTHGEHPWRLVSSGTYLDEIQTPTLLFVGALDGEKDTDVPAQWGVELAFRLRTLQKNFDFVYYPQSGHFFDDPDWTDMMQRTHTHFQWNFDQQVEQTIEDDTTLYPY